MGAPPREFPIRPGGRALAGVALAVGVVLLVAAAALQGAARAYALVCGALGVVVGGAALRYAATRRYRIVVDDLGLEVRRGDETRLRLLWGDVRRVVCVPATRTLWIDGGDPARRLLVTGPDAPGPYVVEGREALYDLVRARVPADRIEEAESLGG